MPRSTTDLKAQLNDGLEKAKQFHAEAIEARSIIETQDRTELERAWQCGKQLNYLKSLQPHGNWVSWIENQWPELGSSTRELYMKIDRDNPNARRVGDLKHDSIRKYRLAAVPKKKHPKEAGDTSFSKPEHHSTVVNELARLTQRIDAGQVKGLDLEELRSDFRPSYEWLQRLYGDA